MTFFKKLWNGFLDRLAGLSSSGTPGQSKWPKRIAIAAVVIVALYYPIGMAVYQTIDDDLTFEAPESEQIQGASRAVATAAGLMDREIDRWAPNKPIWHPAYFLDNMPNFQLGIQYAVSRFAIELGDYLGRTRGSSAIDPDLDRAAGLLKYDGTIWYWGSGNIIPTATATSQYDNAIKALKDYNRRLASGEATYDKRADNLIALLDRVAADLGSASASLDERVLESNAGYFDFRADDIFYNVKGRLYGYYLILRDVESDFSDVVAEKGATSIYDRMLTSMRTAAQMDPWIVANGRQDGFIVPSHLSAQGFYLLRARTQIRELGDALAK